MAKKFLFLAVVALAMTACSQDETESVNAGKGISFRTTTDVSSRANEMNLSSLQSFKVYASIESTKNPLFLSVGSPYVETVSKTTNGVFSTFLDNHIYYWPTDNSTVNFSAYAPVDDAVNGSFGTASNSNAIAVTDFVPAEKVADQKDVVVAYNSGNAETNEQTGQPLNFKHILSRIKVSAVCDGKDNLRMKIVGIRINRAAGKGSFLYANPTSTSAVVSPAADARKQITNDMWTVDTTVAGNYYKVLNYKEAQDESNCVTIGGSNKAVTSLMFGDDYFMTIPQALTAYNTNWAAHKDAADGTVIPESKDNGGAYIAVLCQVWTEDTVETNGVKTTIINKYFPKKWVKGDTRQIYGWAVIGTGLTWEPGKCYHYIIHYNGGGIGAYDPEPFIPGDPGDPDDPNYPDPTNPDDPGVDPGSKDDEGNDILGKQLYFTVSVTDWDCTGEVHEVVDAGSAAFTTSVNNYANENVDL
jgi:hypothetical protein